MPEMMKMESPKKAGFVDRGFNHVQRKRRMEEEEQEIARLEAEARGEEYVNQSEPSGESVEDTEVQTSGDTQQEEAATEEVQTQEDDSNLSAEEKSFKKRYGDIRKHLAAKEKEWQEKFESLERLQGSKSITPPKTDEDIEKWAAKYPDVAGIVETIATKKAKELFSKAEARLAELDEAQAEADRVKSENAIRKVHSDFDDLRNSDAFHDWAESQPKWVRDALYENMDDPASVVRVIDLYKVDNGLTTAAKKENRRAAASTVTKGSRASIDTKGTSGQIKESEVAKMSPKEFEKRQDEISEAMRSGKFIYDMSGAAR